VEHRRIGGRDDGFPGCPWFEGAFVEPSPRTPSGEPPTIGGFGEADVAMVMLQLNLARQIAEAEEFERAVALASDADITVVLIGTTEKVFNERDEAVRRMSASLIEEAHRASRKVGICGQAPSDCPDFAAFLVEQGCEAGSLCPSQCVPRER
jgi:pyruvate,water dikinase